MTQKDALTSHDYHKSMSISKTIQGVSETILEGSFINHQES